MKRNILFYIFSVCLLMTGLSACSLEHDESGKLGGFWHLVSIDSLGKGGVADLSNEYYFWSIQGNILEVSNVPVNERIIFRYEHKNDSLLLCEPRINNRRLSDTLITDIRTLLPYGLTQLEERFSVEALSHSKMVLRSKKLELRFKSF